MEVRLTCASEGYTILYENMSKKRMTSTGRAGTERRIFEVKDDRCCLSFMYFARRGLGFVTQK